MEDIVQSALTEALSPTAPTDDEALQRWLIGVARHKIADRHRRSRRESFEVPELHVEAPPHAENDLVRWAERALPAEGDEPRRTFEWMMREGDGEKLESIAASEQIPAPRVRKRVSRLRRHLRAAWRKEVALLAALGVVVVLVWLARRHAHEPIAHDDVRPVPSTVAPAPTPAIDPAPPPAPPLPAPVPAPTPSAGPRAPTSLGPAPSADPTSMPPPSVVRRSPAPHKASGTSPASGRSL